jgi:protein SCO1
MTLPPARSPSLPVYLVLAVALAAGLGLLASQHWFGARPAPRLEGGLTYPEPRPLPHFVLDSTEPGGVGPDDLSGRWTLAFIGFTHCPDVCPTTLARLAEAQRQAAAAGNEVPRILFVSVDPERDDAARTTLYARHFSADSLAATADHDRLQPFTRALGMVYMQSPLADGGYSVDHSASVAVIDPRLRLVAQLRPPLDATTIAADLVRLQEHYR